MSQSFESTIEVDCPVSTVYNQWTQFEEFPQFMKNVKEVRQLDDTHLHWVAEIAGRTKEWDAEIIEQAPDRAIQWKAIDGSENAGSVIFDPIDDSHTKITLKLEVEPDGIIESAGTAVGIFESQVKTDLENFAKFIEDRGAESGAWRGEVHDGQEETSFGSQTFSSSTVNKDQGFKAY